MPIQTRNHPYHNYTEEPCLFWTLFPLLLITVLNALNRKKRDYTLQQGPNIILTGLGFAAYTHTFCGKMSHVTSL